MNHITRELPANWTKKDVQSVSVINHLNHREKVYNSLGAADIVVGDWLAKGIGCDVRVNGYPYQIIRVAQ